MERLEIPPPVFSHRETEKAIKKIKRYRENYISKMRAKGWTVSDVHDEIILTPPPEKELGK